MARTEELHKKLEEKTREIIRFQELLNTHVKFTPHNLPEDQDVVQLSPADPVEGSPNDWNFQRRQQVMFSHKHGILYQHSTSSVF